MPPLFPEPVTASLTTAQSHHAQLQGLALKFPRDVIPFAALLEATTAALADLHTLLEPGESTWVIAYQPLPATGAFKLGNPALVQQLEFPVNAPIPTASRANIETLTCAHSAEMVALTDAAFPGFFRRRTCELGPYFGIRNESGQLIAQCGERMNIVDGQGQPWRELSGLCTLPECRGRGHAVALIAHLLALHRSEGHRSYLHVASSNTNAIALYHRLGFLYRGEFPMLPITRLP